MKRNIKKIISIYLFTHKQTKLTDLIMFLKEIKKNQDQKEKPTTQVLFFVSFIKKEKNQKKKPKK